MKRIGIVTGLLVLLPMSAVAQDYNLAARIRECAAIGDETLRLAAFDRLAASIASPPPSVKNVRVASWSMTTEANPLDDSQTVALMLHAADVGATAEGPVTLILRCQSKSIEAYISWGVYLGSSAFVTWRVDPGRATAEQWTVSTDGTSTFCPSNEMAFVDQLVQADRLVARVTPPNANPITAVFNLDGIREAVAPLLAECGGK
jgi:type VI secretion system protein VasI